MGRVLLVFRLAARDLRRRRAEAALLLLAIVAATTTLTLGLVLHGVTSHPYQSTREATAGPDVVANLVAPPTGEPPTSPASRRWPTLPASSATADRTRSPGRSWGHTATRCRWRQQGATPHRPRSTSPSRHKAAGYAMAAWWSRPPSPTRSAFAPVIRSP